MCVYEVSNCEQDSVHVHSCVIYNCVRKLPMGTDSRGWEGFVWPTKDICGMSFLGEGLQLVVTPAVLSVAVPGMLHHLKKKITIQLIRRCEVSWLGLRSSNKHKERRRRKSMTKQKQKKKKHFCLIKQLCSAVQRDKYAIASVVWTILQFQRKITWLQCAINVQRGGENSMSFITMNLIRATEY